MSKYTFEEKLEAVLRVENEGMTLHESGMVIGCKKAEVLKWRNLYREHGPEALLNGGASYDGEFKVTVVEYMHANSLSSNIAAAKFGVKSSSNVRKWERIYNEEGPEGLLKRKPRGRSPGMNKKANLKKKATDMTLEELIEENERLQMENEYLKKLNALVQERITRENGKEPPSSTN